jgi:uncharacterized protein
MRILLLVILLLSNCPGNGLLAQSGQNKIERPDQLPQRYYPVPAFSMLEGDAFADAMAQLALERKKYYDTIFATCYFAATELEQQVRNRAFRVQLVAKDYTGCIAQLQNMRTLETDPANQEAIGMVYQVYSQAAIQAGTENKPDFDSAYRQVFRKVHDALSEPGRELALNYYYTSAADIYTALDNYSSQLKKDTITTLDGNGTDQLIRLFLSNRVYGRVLPLAAPIVKYYDNLNYEVREDVKIPMRDGTRLSAIIVLNKKIPYPGPVVLMVNCYPSFSDAGLAKANAQKGYHAVLVHNRGKAKSEGVFEPFEHDAKDNYDIIDWISKQQWSNQKVGMYGGSYLGFTQWAATKYMHPALKTIVPQVSVGAGIDFPMFNNIFNTYNLRWLQYVTNNKMTDGERFGDDAFWDALNRQLFVQGLPFRQLDSLAGKKNAIFQRWQQHPSYDHYWASMAPATPAEFSRINIPILTITGYFDDDQRGAIYYYDKHHRHAAKAISDNHYFFIGPYSHGGAQGFPTPKVGGYTVDQKALVKINQLVFDWFDYTLKGKERPALLADRVNYFMMGSNEWKHSPSMSSMNNDTLQFYLSTKKNNGYYTLATAPPAKEENIPFTFDLTETGDTLSEGYNGDGGFFKLGNGYLYQKQQLIFESETLQEDIDFTGSFIGKLFLSIDKKDMDLRIDLYEIDVSNNSFPLSTNNIHRLGYVADRSKRTLLTPGKITRFDLGNHFFTSKRIQKGNRIRVVMAPLNLPLYQKNYGTGRPVISESKKDARPFKIVFYAGKQYAGGIGMPRRR